MPLICFLEYLDLFFSVNFCAFDPMGFITMKLPFEPRKKTLVICYIDGIILPSYMGIILNHYKDPY